MVAKPLYPLYKNIIKPLDRVRYPELRYYDTLHTESREYLIEDVIECLTNWEKKN